MKKTIENYLKTDRSYNEGIKLYNQYGNKMAFKKQLNAQPETDYIKEVLYDQLAELAGIPHARLHEILNTPVSVFKSHQPTVSPEAQKAPGPDKKKKTTPKKTAPKKKVSKKKAAPAKEVKAATDPKKEAKQKKAAAGKSQEKAPEEPKK